MLLKLKYKLKIFYAIDFNGSNYKHSHQFCTVRFHLSIIHMNLSLAEHILLYPNQIFSYLLCKFIFISYYLITLLIILTPAISPSNKSPLIIFSYDYNMEKQNLKLKNTEHWIF